MNYFYDKIIKYFYDKIVNYFFNVKQAKTITSNDVTEKKHCWDHPIFIDCKYNEKNKKSEPIYLNSAILKDFKQLLQENNITYCHVEYCERTDRQKNYDSIPDWRGNITPFICTHYGIATFLIPMEEINDLLPLLGGFKFNYHLPGQYIIHESVPIPPFKIMIYY
jgi:hypothetical protein